MAFCPKCGEQIPQGASFCTNCGTPAVSVSQGQAASASTVPNTAARTRDGKKIGLIVLISVLSLALITVGILMATGVLQLSSKAPAPQESPTASLRPGEESPAAATEAPSFPTPPAFVPTPEPASTPEPAHTPMPDPTLPFPCGYWSGSYVYNGNFFQTFFELNQDNSCRRVIYKNGEVTRDQTGNYEYSDSEIRLYLDGDRNTWTAYDVSGEMMVNNNHEFFRKDPGGLIGAWIGDYVYNGNNIHSTYILRTDGTYSEVTTRNGEVVTDEEGTYTFDGSELVLRPTGKNYSTPFDYIGDVLYNNNFPYTRAINPW